MMLCGHLVKGCQPQLSTPVDWYLDSSRFEDEGLSPVRFRVWLLGSIVDLSCNQPLCPAYTETSDFVDTASSTCGLKTAGYSRVFRTGLATKVRVSLRARESYLANKVILS